MKIRLPFFLFAMLLSLGINSQIVILDHETPETTTTFQFFGSSLEGVLSNVIANPDPSGINTSANVGEFIKPANSEVWAGGFANPQTQPINVLTGNEICIKVWMPAAGNLALKLEQGSQPDWTFTQEVTTAQEWVEVCYDPNQNSIEGDMVPATGGIYNQLVLFFDFQMNFTEEKIYYFDDVTVAEGNTSAVDVTFAVDMNEYTSGGGSFTSAYVSGSFNGWSGTSNPLSDDDADGIWTGTITLDPGSYEYKFTLDDWAVQEEFGGKSYECTVTDGTFTNRGLTVGANETLPTRCWNSCYGCGDAVDITINLGTAAIDVSPEGVYIAGGGNFGNPGDFPLADPDGDQVYSIVLERQAGFQSFYTFTNGACPDYSCKEDISGQSCAFPDNFNDRNMGPFDEDATISTCFGECTDSTDGCMGSSEPIDITFSVDMSNYSDPFTTAYVSGSFNNWSGDGNPLADDDGDGIYSTTVNLNPGTYEFKFTLDNWAVQEEFNEGDPCTITTGEFTNRIVMADEDTELCFAWNTCDGCLLDGVADIDAADDLFKLAPSMVQTYTTLLLNGAYSGEKEVIVFNTLGEIVLSRNIRNGVSEYVLSAEDLSNGIYYINVQTENVQQTQRMIVNK